MFYLGIDQHAKQPTVNLRDTGGDVVLRRQVSTQPEKLLDFFECLTQRCAEMQCGFWAIVEVCGFNDWLLEMLKNFRCQRIVLVQPEETDRRKTDRRDAAKISEQLWLFRDRIAAGKRIDKLKIVTIPDSIRIQQRRLTTLRKDARSACSRAINQIKHMLRRHNLQHDMPTKTFPTIAALEWLQTLQLAVNEGTERNDWPSKGIANAKLFLVPNLSILRTRSVSHSGGSQVILRSVEFRFPLPALRRMRTSMCRAKPG